MPVVAIKCADGNYLGIDREGRATKCRWHYLFDMQRVGDGFTFRIVGSDDYLCLSSSDSEGAIGAKEGPAGENGTFTLVVQDAGFLSIRAANGYPIVADGKRSFAAAAGDGTGDALFEIDRLGYGDAIEKELEEGHAHHTSPEKWKEATHIDIVTIGIETLLRGQSGRSDVKRFFQSLWLSPDYQKGLFQGLKDADILVRFTQLGLFVWHFYDPTTGNNWTGIGPNARSVGSYYTTKSLVAAVALMKPGGHPVADYYHCGYDLGVALHFLTDLTQPMHAANFTEASSPAGMHGAFEKFVNDNRVEIWKRWPPSLSGADLDEVKKSVVDGTFQVSSYFHDTAVAANKVWKDPFSRWIAEGGKPSLDDPVIATVLDASTRQAPARVARLLFAYTVMAETNATLVDETKWYTIKEHTEGKWMSWVLQAGLLNRVRRWDWELGNRHEFCFVPDGKGTYRIAGRHDIDWAWYMVTDNNSNWYYANMDPAENPERNAFYVEHAGVFDGRIRVRIIEPRVEDRITVSWGLWDDNGRALGWGDVTEPVERQTFELVAVAVMDEAEHQKIMNHWAKKIRPGNAG